MDELDSIELEAANGLLLLADSPPLALAPDMPSKVGRGSVTHAMELEGSQGKLAWHACWQQVFVSVFYVQVSCACATACLRLCSQQVQSSGASPRSSHEKKIPWPIDDRGWGYCRRLLSSTAAAESLMACPPCQHTLLFAPAGQDLASSPPGWMEASLLMGATLLLLLEVLPCRPPSELTAAALLSTA